MKEAQNMVDSIDQLENGTPGDLIITLKGVFSKSIKCTVQPSRDKERGWFHGVPRLSEDQKKDLSYFTTPDSKLVLVDGMTFDLRDEVQKANWEWVKHSNMVAMSYDECQRSSQAQFYVHISGREAREANKISDFKYKAMKYIMEDSPTNYENRALILDNDLAGESPEEIKKILVDIATRQPLRVIAAYEAKNLNIKLLYLQAVQRNIIKKEEGMMLFGSTILGMNMEGALAFLQTKDHFKILEMLEKEVEVSVALMSESNPGKPKKNYNFNK